MAKTNNAELLRKMAIFTRRGMFGHGHGPGHGPGHGHGPGRCHGHGPGPDHCHGHGPGGHPDMEGCPRPPFGPGMGRGHHGGALARERLLVTLAEHEGGMRQKELSEIAGNRASAMSEMVAKLETDGYVRRKVDPSDKRATLVTLTELGEARAAEVADERDQMFADLFGCLNDEEKEQLNAILDKLLANLDE